MSFGCLLNDMTGTVCIAVRMRRHAVRRLPHGTSCAARCDAPEDTVDAPVVRAHKKHTVQQPLTHAFLDEPACVRPHLHACACVRVRVVCVHMLLQRNGARDDAPLGELRIECAERRSSPVCATVCVGQ